MCGICGLYSPSGAPPPAVVDAMRARIRHRGPDQGSTDAFGRVRARPPAAAGARPRARLPAGRERARRRRRGLQRRALQLPRAAPRPRCARPRRARTRRHAGHPAPVRGIRAVASSNGSRACSRSRSGTQREQRLLLARDRLGKKPLVWTRLDDGTFAFASEVKALLTVPGVRREPDLGALDAYLALQYVPGERTGLQRHPSTRRPARCSSSTRTASARSATGSSSRMWSRSRTMRGSSASATR